ncbi:SGNH/GDSL hydrolase family protein [bacterium]|nr:SGNH/GDSL hydrolase family protein [bacterium]
MRFIFTVLMLFVSMTVSAVSLDKVVVFGDSLSDNGNLYEYMKHQMPISPPYYQGRFTNGPVWVELLVQSYYANDPRSHLLDYAFGGAGIAVEDGDDDDETLFTLRREIDSYLLAHQDKADAKSLFVMWMGSNNYLAIPDDVEQTVDDVILGIRENLERLVLKGAKHIMVINLPDLGQTPAARDFDAVDILTDCSAKHNANLKSMIEEFKIQYPDVQWIHFDVNQMLLDILHNPAQFGFTNTSDTCYEEIIDHPSAKSVLNLASTITPHKSLSGDPCAGYLFFDPVHPSMLAHQLMSDRMNQLFIELGIEFVTSQ